MADFINTIDALGDDAVIDSIIQRTITEFKDNVLTVVGKSALRDCKALVSIDIQSATIFWNEAFSGCVSLTSVNAPLLTDLRSNAFANCSALVAVNLPALISIEGTAFKSCTSLAEITLPSLKTMGLSVFTDCKNLVKADFPLLEEVKSNAFSACYSLKAVILRNTVRVNATASQIFTNCSHILGTVHATYNPEGLADGYIYVPRALVESYKTATNWSVYATQFRALEDYTVDGSITGELDETKI